MRIKKASGFVMFAAFAIPAFVAPAMAAEAPAFVGEWTATADAPTGKVSETVTVVKTGEGYAITGKLVIPGPEGSPEGGPGTDIVLDGNNFTYKRTVATPGGPFVITYTGVVSGDTFTGEIQLGDFGKIPYNGVRIKHRG
jgi:hypothetical protein